MFRGITSPVSIHISFKTIEAKPSLFKVSGLLSHFLINTLQRPFSFPKAPSKITYCTAPGNDEIGGAFPSFKKRDIHHGGRML